MLTVKADAERLGISQSLVYDLVASRRLRFCRVGNGRGRIRISEDAIGEYLARCTFGPQEKSTPTRVEAPARLKHLRTSSR